MSAATKNNSANSNDEHFGAGTTGYFPVFPVSP